MSRVNWAEERWRPCSVSFLASVSLSLRQAPVAGDLDARASPVDGFVASDDELVFERDPHVAGEDDPERLEARRIQEGGRFTSPLTPQPLHIAFDASTPSRLNAFCIIKVRFLFKLHK